MKADLESIRYTLEARIKEAAPTRGLRESIHIHPAADPADTIQQATERDLAVHHLNSDSRLGQRLRAAIDRLKEGSYGACLECGRGIAPKRLKAIPWAELCIQCQERADDIRRAA